MLPTLLLLVVVVTAAAHAHPLAAEGGAKGELEPKTKRAFDRLDTSMFDFDAMTNVKRFDDGWGGSGVWLPGGYGGGGPHPLYQGHRPALVGFGDFELADEFLPILQVDSSSDLDAAVQPPPQKRTFDRLEHSAFFGGFQKRAFDRLDASAFFGGAGGVGGGFAGGMGGPEKRRSGFGYRRRHFPLRTLARFIDTEDDTAEQ